MHLFQYPISFLFTKMVPDICVVLFPVLQFWQILFDYVYLENKNQSEVLSPVILLNLVAVVQLLQEWLNAVLVLNNISAQRWKIHKVIRLMNGYRLVIRMNVLFNY